MCKVLLLWQEGLIAKGQDAFFIATEALFLYSKRYAFPLVDKG